MRPGPQRLSPGVLTKARSVGVRNSRLAAAAAARGLHLLVRMRGQKLQELVRGYADGILGDGLPAVVAAATGADGRGGKGGGGGGGGGGVQQVRGSATAVAVGAKRPAAPTAADDNAVKLRLVPNSTNNGSAAAAAPAPANNVSSSAAAADDSNKRPRWQPLSLGLLRASAHARRHGEEALAAAAEAAAAAAQAAVARAVRPAPGWGEECEVVWRRVWQQRHTKCCLEVSGGGGDDNAAGGENGNGGAAAGGADQDQGQDQQQQLAGQRKQQELKPPKVLADVIESLLAAVFFDSGGDLATVWRVLLVCVDMDLLQRDAESLAATAELRGTRLDTMEV